MVTRFNEIDHGLGLAVAEGFGIEVKEPSRPNHGKTTTGAQPFSMLVRLLPSRFVVRI